MVPFDTIWDRLVSLGTDWVHLVSFGTIWVHLSPFRNIWHYSGQFGSIQDNFGPLGIIWNRLENRLKYQEMVNSQCVGVMAHLRVQQCTKYQAKLTPVWVWIVAGTGGSS